MPSRLAVLHEPMIRRVLLVEAVVVPIEVLWLWATHGHRASQLGLVVGLSVAAGLFSILFFVVILLVADGVVRSGRIPADWAKRPTPRQLALGVSLMLVAALVGAAVPLLLG